jgi:hypothetical protein
VSEVPLYQFRTPRYKNMLVADNTPDFLVSGFGLSGPFCRVKGYRFIIRDTVPPDYIMLVGVLRMGPYRATSLMRNRHLVGPYIRTMPRLIWWC